MTALIRPRVKSGRYLAHGRATNKKQPHLRRGCCISQALLDVAIATMAGALAPIIFSELNATRRSSQRAEGLFAFRKYVPRIKPLSQRAIWK